MFRGMPVAAARSFLCFISKQCGRLQRSLLGSELFDRLQWQRLMCEEQHCVDCPKCSRSTFRRREGL